MNLTRRALIGLAGEAALLGGFPPLARADVESSDVRSFGARGDGRTDDTVAFVKASKSGVTVLIPEKLHFRIDGNVDFENCNLIVEGSIVGKGAFHFGGTVEIRGSGRVSLGQPLGAFQFNKVGRFLIDGIRFEDCQSLAAISIAPELGDEIESLTIQNCRFQGINYGILRQASDSYGGVNVLTISQNTFESVRGDAIELNCVTKDKKILIEGNVIRNVDNPDKKPFWGIGIGLSGRRYTENSDPEASVKNFVVRNNRLENLRQGIHVEQGYDFVIADNTITNIGPDFSRDSGLDVRGIVAYGCSDFKIIGNTVQNVTAGPAISVEFGVENTRYIGAPRNYEIVENTVSGIISCSSGGDNAYVVIRQNRADGVRHAGQVNRLLVQENEIRAGSSKPFDIDVGPVGWVAWLKSSNKGHVDFCGNRVGGAPYKIDDRGSGRVVSAESCAAVTRQQ